MNLVFNKVGLSNMNDLLEVLKIINLSGEDMYENQNLSHWKRPYSLDDLMNSLENREVFLVRNKQDNHAIHTFQLSLPHNFENLKNQNALNARVATLSKFATLPSCKGRGIGSQSMNYIFQYCRQNNINKIVLEVYTKSKIASSFYKKHGFVIVSIKPTKNFEVYIMEKYLQS